MKIIFTCILLTSMAQLLPAQEDQKNYKKTVTIYTTAKGTSQRITEKGTQGFKEFKQPLETQPCVFIDEYNTYQTFMGVGGAITDASAETFAKLPKTQQEAFLKACFDPKEGIGYKIARTNINSCDFSSFS